MKPFWQMAAFFLILCAAWYLTYSENSTYVYAGFAMMGILMLFSLFTIVKGTRHHDEQSKGD